MPNLRTNGWDERDYKLWSALGVLPSYGRMNGVDHLISLHQVEAVIRKHAEDRYAKERYAKEKSRTVRESL